MIGINVAFGMKPSSTDLDVTEPTSIDRYISSQRPPSLVLHMAALNIRDCSDNVSEAMRVNIDGTTNMLKVAQRFGIPFVLISSGAVFSSPMCDAEFDERAPPSPNSIYGSTKACAENIALTYSKTILVRTGWVFGGHQRTHYEFVELTLSNLLSGTHVYACNDEFGSPTYVADLLDTLYTLIREESYGIHHVVNTGYACCHDIAMTICDEIGANTGLVRSVPGSEVPNRAQRSSSECLVNTNTRHTLRRWDEALRDYLSCRPGIRAGGHLNMEPSSTAHGAHVGAIRAAWRTRAECRLCNAHALEVFLKLNPTPLANALVPSPKDQPMIPLDVASCGCCKHIQLMQIVPPELLYPEYPYASSASTTMVKHLQTAIDGIVSEFGILKSDRLLEIGANDGVIIRHLLENGFTNVIGVDPANNISKRHELPILCDYFGPHVKSALGDKYHLIYGFHCCAHIEDIEGVFRTVFDLLDDNGMFVFEVGYLYDVIQNNSFDTIYHEHIDYHTCTAMVAYARRMGLKLFHVKRTPVQGGSIQFYCSKNNDIDVRGSVAQALAEENAYRLHTRPVLEAFGTRIKRCLTDVRYLLRCLVENGKQLAGYGASAKSTTFLHQITHSKTLLSFIIDDSPHKQNLYSPGLHFPIRPLSILDSEPVDYVLILSWNFSQELLEKLEPYRRTGLRVIIPFPSVHIM